MSPVALGKLRELFLAHGLRRLAKKCEVVLQEPLTIDSNGEISIVASTGDSVQDLRGCGKYGEKMADVLSKYNTRNGSSASVRSISPADGWLRMNHFEVEKMLRAQRLFKNIPNAPNKPALRYCEGLQFELKNECFRQTPEATGIYIRWFEDMTAEIVAVHASGGKAFVRPLYNRLHPGVDAVCWKIPQDLPFSVCWQQVGRVAVPRRLEKNIPVCWHAWMRDGKPQLISFPIIHQQDHRLVYQGLHMVVEQPPTDERESGMTVHLTQKEAVREFKNSQLKETVYYRKLSNASYKIAMEAIEMLRNNSFKKWRMKSSKKVSKKP